MTAMDLMKKGIHKDTGTYHDENGIDSKDG